MWHILFFYCLLAAATAYALIRGGPPERWGAAILLAGTVATWAAVIGIGGSHSGHFIGVEYGVLIIDALMVVALFAVAACADRFWPLWMTAMQAFGVFGHLAKILAPEIMPNVYQAAHLFSAYPVTILLIAATRWHRRRMREQGGDRSWSISWRRSTSMRPAIGPTG